MVREAEENKEADEKRKEEVEVKNKAESLINDINYQLSNEGDKISPEQKAQVEKLRDELKTALDNNDIATLKTRMEELEKAAAMMQQGNGNPNAGQPQAQEAKPENGNDDVIDADFSDKKN
jgi:molecular chaperone DnaK